MTLRVVDGGSSPVLSGSRATSILLELKLVPGSIVGRPVTAPILSRVVNDGKADVVDLELLASEIAPFAAALSAEGATSGLQVHPSDTKFARIGTFAYEPGTRNTLSAGFKSPEGVSDLVLVYFDRPCELKGASKDRAGRSVEIEATIRVPGFHWLLVSAAPAGARRVALAPPISGVVLLVERASPQTPTMQGRPPPPFPSEPQPLSSFAVEFVPEGSERYSPTETRDIVRFRNVLQYPGEPERALSEVGSPTRPYVKIGELKFGLNWYYSSNIRELMNAHVPRVGGDAVLVYHAYPGGAAAMDIKQGAQIFYQSIVLEVIRYTDR